MPFNFPTDDKRVVILGRTGSGKTRAGVWQFAFRSFDKMPWLIVDFKLDDLIGQIPSVRKIGVDEIPRAPGIYTVRPLPTETDELDELLWRVWNRGQTGLYLDEGLMVARSPAFQAILTQGRSKKIPVITLSQRPKEISRFTFTEANYFQIFHLVDSDDRKRVREITGLSTEKRLPDYHSYWYDVDKDDTVIMKPVPDDETILEIIEKRLKRRKRLL